MPHFGKVLRSLLLYRSCSHFTSSSYTLTKLSDRRLLTLTTLQNKYVPNFNSSLNTICVPRVVGTDGNKAVREYIVKTMQSLNWLVEENSFTDDTPFGQKPFTNVIATLNPSACRRLVIACHHDSLSKKDYTFLGATDSAVPCAMMLTLAQALDSYLKKQKEKSNQITLQYIFFDGEEALQSWSSTDSLYGSRHLAAKWNKERVEPLEHCSDDFVSQLDRIDVLMLLDLIGCPNPQFYSYFSDTQRLFGRLLDIEKRLTGMGQLDKREKNRYFINHNKHHHYVEDDHTPFMQKGVPILHMIPVPFPNVWHKESDNLENLHHPTIHDLLKILFAFVAEYLHLTIPETTA